MQAGQKPELPRQLDLAGICDGNTYKLVTSHAHALGVPDEYYFYPLLCSVAGLMGSSRVQVHDDWQESCSLWCGVVGRRGSRRSSTLSRLLGALQKAQTGREQIRPSVWNEDQTNPPSSTTTNSGLLALQESLMPALARLAHQTQYSIKRQYDTPLPNSTHQPLSAAGFVLPQELNHMAEASNTDILARIILTCPEPAVFKSTDLRVPIPANTPSIVNILQVLGLKHEQPCVYTLNSNASKTFYICYDAIVQSMGLAGEDDQKYSVFSVAAGQMLRVAGAMAALRQALKFVVYHEDVAEAVWQTEVQQEDMDAAKHIIEHSLQTKLSLLHRLDKTSATVWPVVGSTPAIPPVVNAARTAVSTLTAPPSAAKRQRIMLPNHDLQQHFSLSASSATTVSPAASRSPVTRSPAANAQMLPAEQPVFPGMVPILHAVPTVIQPDTGLSPMGEVTGDSTSPDRSISSATSDWSPSDINDMQSMSAHHTIPALRMDYSETELQQFVDQYGYKIKRLLEYQYGYKITPSICAQRHLMASLSRNEMVQYNTTTRYPVALAREYLAKISQLGFGTIENYNVVSNNRRSLYFQKYPYSQLSEKAMLLLKGLEVTMGDYMAGFNPNMCQIRQPPQSPANLHEGDHRMLHIAAQAGQLQQVNHPLLLQPKQEVVESPSEVHTNLCVDSSSVS